MTKINQDAIRKRAEDSRDGRKDCASISVLADDVLVLLDAHEAWRTKNEDELKFVVQLRIERDRLAAENAKLRKAIEQVLGEQRDYGWYPPESLIDHLRAALDNSGGAK